MLRSGALKSLQPAWRSPLISLRHQSTAAAAAVEVEQPAEQRQQRQQRVPLSSRLGGSGRGKSLEAADPFAAFLNNAQQKNRRMPQRGNRKASAAAPGQFDDAQEKKPQQQQQRPRKNNNRPQRQKAANDQQKSADGQPQKKAANDKQQPKRQQRQNKTPRKAVESRRVTTFIDKDIDWTAISGFDDQEAEVAAAMVAGSAEEQTPETREKLMAELQTGDYERYFQVANGLTFAPTVSVDTLNCLMGANASYGFNQKTAFLSAVSKATAGAAAAARK
ncbi:hypothetical protein BJV82DRAFT_181951 [Fennellomyces sp. T-0311]|nr:hypothetical protein BJV82DRAFT_181951 [Fennellomyces sp. T-0311]